MKRVNPFMSLAGFLATILLLTGLGALLWYSGGTAFSPGRLSAKSQKNKPLNGFTSHAAFEAECERCHQPFKTTQAELCLECHLQVEEEVMNKKGTHSLIDGVRQCYTCHSDHQGEDFDPSRAAYAHFDHSRTHFSLIRHQVNYSAAPMACADCHPSGSAEFTITDTSCTQCHGVKDAVFMLQHSQYYGTDCTTCHDGLDLMADFDHQDTDFPLQGKHAQVVCAECHKVSKEPGSRGGGGSALALFVGAPLECVECHAEEDPHPGMFSTRCSDCHQSAGWTPATWEAAPFEHAAVSGFSLVRHEQDFDGTPLLCNDCHLGLVQEFKQESCVACHSQSQEEAAFMVGHQEQYGQDCAACHDGIDRMANFNHETVFPLDGQHAEIACEGCHANQVFVGTPRTCVECHAEPALHAGFFGLQCQYCHSTSAWAPAPLHAHIFPLDHGEQGEVECKVCHTETYAEYTCYGCHEHEQEETTKKHVDEGIPMDEIPNCTRCHATGLVEENAP